ncbi:hypothetical protein COOONC_05988 [Cooperia oncophora]
MNIPPAFPMPQASNYQSDPDKMSSAISYLEVKVMDAKKTIEELLYMLDMQEKVPCLVHTHPGFDRPTVLLQCSMFPEDLLHCAMSDCTEAPTQQKKPN